MSVLAYNSIANSNESIQQPTQNNVDATANISANARIDYILRFSKQLVIAVTPQVSEYAPINSQFLANLPHTHNAALVAASNQFNDIQIRSRIIEQLFANILFDPEQSLAVSLINLIQEQPQDISIAIEHAQFLSIQILHELTQLAAIAKKSDLTINVLVTGNYALGHKLSKSSALFKGKSSIINGMTGQLIPFNSPLFKQPIIWFSIFYLKVAAILLTLIIFTLSGFYLYTNDEQASLVDQSLVDSEFVKADESLILSKSNNNTLHKKLLREKSINKAADSTDIMNALFFDQALIVKNANQQDILHALTLPSTAKDEKINTLTTHNIILEAVEPTISISEKPLGNEFKEVSVKLSNQSEIYFSLDTGYVIQFAAFSDNKVKADFIKLFPDLSYHRYYRKIENKTFEVFTSKPYRTRSEVDSVREQLPESVKSLNVWVKTLTIVQEEITSFEHK